MAKVDLPFSTDHTHTKTTTGVYIISLISGIKIHKKMKSTNFGDLHVAVGYAPGQARVGFSSLKIAPAKPQLHKFLLVC